MAGHHLDGIDFSKQADMMAKATDAINEMVKQLARRWRTWKR